MATCNVINDISHTISNVHVEHRLYFQWWKTCGLEKPAVADSTEADSAATKEWSGSNSGSTGSTVTIWSSLVISRSSVWLVGEVTCWRAGTTVHQIAYQRGRRHALEITSDHERRWERGQSLRQIVEVIEERLRHAAGIWTVDNDDDGVETVARWRNAATTSNVDKTSSSTLRARSVGSYSRQTPSWFVDVDELSLRGRALDTYRKPGGHMRWVAGLRRRRATSRPRRFGRFAVFCIFYSCAASYGVIKNGSFSTFPASNGIKRAALKSSLPN